MEDSTGSLRLPFLAAVLAGGESRRMGRDKALLPFQGRPMIQQICEIAGKVFSSLVVITGRPENYGFLDLPVLPDLYPGCGALGGIHAALVHGQGQPVFILACDYPLVTPALLHHVATFSDAQVMEKRNPWASIPGQDGHLHPLCGLYSADCLEAAERRLRAGRWKVLDFLTEIETVEVPVTPNLPFFHSHLLLNVNRTEEYEVACRTLVERVPETA